MYSRHAAILLRLDLLLVLIEWLAFAYIEDIIIKASEKKCTLPSVLSWSAVWALERLGFVPETVVIIVIAESAVVVAMWTLITAVDASVSFDLK